MKSFFFHFQMSFESLSVHQIHIQNISWAEGLQQIPSLLFLWENGPVDGRHLEACRADEHEIAFLPHKSESHQK